MKLLLKITVKLVLKITKITTENNCEITPEITVKITDITTENNWSYYSKKSEITTETNCEITTDITTENKWINPWFNVR